MFLSKVVDELSIEALRLVILSLSDWEKKDVKLCSSISSIGYIVEDPREGRQNFSGILNRQGRSLLFEV